VKYDLEQPGKKLLALTNLDSNTWDGSQMLKSGKLKLEMRAQETERPGGQEAAADRRALHSAISAFCFPNSSFSARPPARALAAATLTQERTLSDLVNQAYFLTPAEIDLMWQTAPPRMPVPPPTA
jgi:hypothetical protein